MGRPLDAVGAEHGYLVPMMLRDRIVAVLYADQAPPASQLPASGHSTLQRMFHRVFSNAVTLVRPRTANFDAV